MTRASLARFGKEHLKGRPSLPRCVHPHDTTHVVHRARHDGETQPGSSARLLGGVERVEDLLAILGGYPGPRVRYVQEHPPLADDEVGPGGATLGAAWKRGPLRIARPSRRGAPGLVSPGSNPENHD